MTPDRPDEMDDRVDVTEEAGVLAAGVTEVVAGVTVGVGNVAGAELTGDTAVIGPIPIIFGS